MNISHPPKCLGPPSLSTSPVPRNIFFVLQKKQRSFKDMARRSHSSAYVPPSATGACVRARRRQFCLPYLFSGISPSRFAPWNKWSVGLFFFFCRFSLHFAMGDVHFLRSANHWKPSRSRLVVIRSQANFPLPLGLSLVMKRLKASLLSRLTPLRQCWAFSPKARVVFLADLSMKGVARPSSPLSPPQQSV